MSKNKDLVETTFYFIEGNFYGTKSRLQAVVDSLVSFPMACKKTIYISARQRSTINHLVF